MSRINVSQRTDAYFHTPNAGACIPPGQKDARTAMGTGQRIDLGCYLEVALAFWDSVAIARLG